MFRHSLVLAIRRHGAGGVWLALRLLAWRMALPHLKRVVPLAALVRLMWPRRRSVERNRKREQRIAAGVDRVFGRDDRRSKENCLERSLLVYRFLAQAGADPQLVWGVRKNDDKLMGHAWVVLDGRPLARPDERLDSFTPITTYGPKGHRVHDEQAALGRFTVCSTPRSSD
jgi:hypothetical protein